MLGYTVIKENEIENVTNRSGFVEFEFFKSVRRRIEFWWMIGRMNFG